MQRARVVLLVTAHPDDEVMFFGPTIQCLLRSGTAVHLLCLSTGNADGLGTVRQEELLRACENIGIPCQHIIVTDHPALQDGMATRWHEDVIAGVVRQRISETKADIDTVITFDSYGVSGHGNHRAVHRGVMRLLQRNVQCGDDTESECRLQAWQLVSTSLVRKFLGLLDIPLSLWEGGSDGSLCFLLPTPLRIMRAMSRHHSQWVWYRKLFVVFSRYTYVNTLRRLDF